VDFSHGTDAVQLSLFVIFSFLFLIVSSQSVYTSRSFINPFRYLLIFPRIRCSSPAFVTHCRQSLYPPPPHTQFYPPRDSLIVTPSFSFISPPRHLLLFPLIRYSSQPLFTISLSLLFPVIRHSCPSRPSYVRVTFILYQGQKGYIDFSLSSWGSKCS
jgi:hypothetical protein